MILETLIALSLSGTASAKTFQNSYLSFEVPNNWTCAQEGVAWICNPTDYDTSKEALIVLTAKVAGPSDNLAAFKMVLSKPKSITSKVGTPVASVVNSTRERELAGEKWIQAQHMGSELKDHSTLYLATVIQNLAILVSFTAQQDKIAQYNPIFDKAMKTLKITASQKLLMASANNSASAAGEAIGIEALPTPAPAAAAVTDTPKAAHPRVPPLRTWMMILGALGLLGFAALYWRNSR